MRNILLIIFSTSSLVSAPLAGDTTVTLNNIEIILRGKLTPAIQDQEKFCPQCLDIVKRYREEDTTNLLEEYKEKLSMATGNGEDYTATANFTKPGPWKVAVVISQSENEKHIAWFTVEVKK